MSCTDKLLEISDRPIVAVTGASRGIGHAIVKAFHNSGWEVFTLSRAPFSADCPWASGAIKHVEVDLSDEESIFNATATLEEMLGDRGLNALVNNAGISPKGNDGERLGAIATSLETMKTVQMVNLIAPMLLTQELLASLVKARGGHCECFVDCSL